jgi:hypothetical protein
MPTKAASKEEAQAEEEAVLADLNVLAAEIEKLSTLGEALLKKSKLKRRTICLLIRDACGQGPGSIGMRQIEMVLDAITDLKHIYLKKINDARA